jgi:Pectate lyase superfamily protein
MPMDDRSGNRGYLLPHLANLLSEDVQRLRDALCQIDGDINGLLSGAPSNLNTLAELAAAIGNDPAYAATVATALGLKANAADVYSKTASDARYVQALTQVENTFTGTGSQTSFTLSQTPPSRESLLVTVDGVVQPVSEYSLSGASLTLSEAPASGARVRVLMLGVAGPVQNASTLSFTQSGPGAVTRTVENKLRDWVSVKDFGAVGDGIADDTNAIRAAVAAANAVYFPPGVYRIRDAILIHRSGVALFGAGAGVSIIKMDDAPGLVNYSAIDLRTSRANGGAGDIIADVTIRDLTIDGNKANRSTTAGNCILILCDSSHRIQGTRILGVTVKNSVEAGIMLLGLFNGTNDAYRVETTLVEGCSIFDNKGAGLMQVKASNSTIVNNIFSGSGLENLTVDVYSQSCVIDGNRFFKHLGGTGNIGVDSGDGCIISNNVINNELNTSADPEFRTGIALNSQLTGGGGNTDVVITGNCITNCASYGIYAHDDTGINLGVISGSVFNGEPGGNAVITGNNFANNGTDVRIENCAGPTFVKSNKLTTMVVTDPGVSDVRVGSGDVAFDAYLSSSQTIYIPSNDNAWRRILLGGMYGRLATISSNNLILPVGGFYQFNVKARFEGLNSLDVNYVSLGLGHQPTGGSEVIFSLVNIDANQIANMPLDFATELTLPYAAFLAAGTIRLYMRVQATTAGHVVVKDGVDTRVTGFSIG